MYVLFSLSFLYSSSVQFKVNSELIKPLVKMQAEFERYIKRWKADGSTGIEILDRIMTRKLLKKFTMYGDGDIGQKNGFMFKNTFQNILNVLRCCTGASVWQSFEIFLRHHKCEDDDETKIKCPSLSVGRGKRR
jgi:hypothetical protein